jgi:hypothetical protein
MFINEWQIHTNQSNPRKPPGVLDGSGTHPTICAKETLSVDFFLSLEW